MHPVDANSGLTAERLKQVLRYDPETGIFVWLLQTGASSRCRIGDAAGCLDKVTGYVRIWVDGKRYVAHRLAWLYMTGSWPESLVDHQDTNKSNNSWTNLRVATNSENKANGRVYKKRLNLPKGVCIQGAKFTAQIVHNYRHFHLGTFDTAEAAHQAYVKMAKELHGEFARAA